MSKKTNLEAVFKEIADKHEETFEVNDWLDFQHNLQAEGLTSASHGNSILNSLQQLGSFLTKNFLAMSVLVTTAVLPISQSFIFETSEETSTSIYDIDTENTLVDENAIENPNIETQEVFNTNEVHLVENKETDTAPNLGLEPNHTSNKKHQKSSDKIVSNTKNPKNHHTQKQIEENKPNTNSHKTLENTSHNSTEKETKITEKTQVENPEKTENKNLTKAQKKALRKQKKEVKKKEKEQKRKEQKVDDGDFQYLFKKKKN